LATGEYFHAADADGINLSGADKSVTFEIQAFGNSDALLISAPHLQIDVPRGSIQFNAPSGIPIVLGLGVENTDSIFPANLNFLHTLEVIRGDLLFNAEQVEIQASVGVPSFRNPDNDAKAAPPDARILFGPGLVQGTISWQDAPRVITVEGDGSAERSLPIPSSLLGSTLVLSQQFPLVFGERLVFDDESEIQTLRGVTGPIHFEGGIQLMMGANDAFLLPFLGSGGVIIDLIDLDASAGGSSVRITSEADLELKNWEFEPGGSSPTLILDVQAARLPSGARNTRLTSTPDV
jgi:hypothetical protein